MLKLKSADLVALFSLDSGFQPRFLNLEAQGCDGFGAAGLAQLNPKPQHLKLKDLEAPVTPKRSTENPISSTPTPPNPKS